MFLESRDSFSARKLFATGRFALVAASLLAALSLSSARADVLFYEGFDYATGSDLGSQAGGSGWSNAWGDSSGGNSVVGGKIGAGLTYSDGTNDLQTSGGHYIHKWAGSGSASAVYRKIDLAQVNSTNPGLLFEDTTGFTPGHHIGKDGSTVWVSFIYQSTWDGFSNGGGSANWGGISFDDGDSNLDGAVTGKGTPFVSLDPDPTDPDFPEDRRTLRPFDARGDMGGEKNGSGVGLEFTVNSHRGGGVPDESGGPEVNADPPTFVLMRMDFTGDPSAPNGANEYYETWPKAAEADEIRMWLNPSLSSEPALGTENVYMSYESEFGRDFTPEGATESEFHLFTDRYDFKLDSIHINARADGTLYDELRMGTTFGDVAPIAGGGTDVDLDDDGDVDGADFLAIQRTDPSLISDWQAAYGTSGLSAAAASVPEPTTLALGLLSLTGLALGRRRS